MPMVEPRIVLPHAIGNAHHAHLLIDTLLHGRPLGRIAIALGNTHERTNNGIHAAPAEQPKRTRVIIQDCLSNHARTLSLLTHVALKGNVAHKGTLNHLSRRRKRRLTGSGRISLQLRPSLGIFIAPEALDPMLRKRSILTKLPSRGIRFMGHNIPLIRATPFSPPMRIHLAERMDAIPKKVILRSRIHHSLNIKQIKIQSQMNERVISSTSISVVTITRVNFWDIRTAPIKIISASYAQDKTGPTPPSPATRRPAGSGRPAFRTTLT